MKATKKIIGFTDSVNECECCGKSGLKGTFCLSIDGNEFYYGSTCAFKKHGISKEEISLATESYNDLQKAIKKGFNSVEEMKEKQAKIDLEIEAWAREFNPV